MLYHGRVVVVDAVVLLVLDDGVVPSGVKYRLYGRVTLIGAPGWPVNGSIGTSWLPADAVT